MFLLILIATVVTLAALAVSPYVGWLFAIVLKPIVDIGWSAEYIVLGLTPLEIVGAGLPAILLARMMMFRHEHKRRMPLRGPWLAYVATAFAGSLMYSIEGDYVGAASFLLRTLNGAVAFFSMPLLFGTRERFRALVIAMLVAGLVPMGIGFFEATTGYQFRVHWGSGGALRIGGPYHNSACMRFYAYGALTAIALYWIYFAQRDKWTKVVLIAYATVSAVVLFRVYSKAGFVTIAFAGMAWVLVTRKVLWPTVIVLAVIIANIAFDGMVKREFSRTFEKDIQALEGGEIGNRAFGGRMGLWRYQWAQFWEQDALDMVFGSGEKGGGRKARGGGHNDYIRALQQTGLLGLITYVWLLTAVGLALMRANLRRRKPLALVALVVFLAWIVDTMGLTPSVYTGHQWYSWGLIGIALAGVTGLDEAPQKQQSPRKLHRVAPGDLVGSNAADDRAIAVRYRSDRR